jgi:hypothetical protein
MLGPGATLDPPLSLHPVADQQRVSNMNAVLERFCSIGAVPQQGQVRRQGRGREVERRELRLFDMEKGVCFAA